MEALGDRVNSELLMRTNAVIELIDDAIISLKEISDKLRAALKELYSEEKIINFEPIERELQIEDINV